MLDLAFHVGVILPALVQESDARLELILGCQSQRYAAILCHAMDGLRNTGGKLVYPTTTHPPKNRVKIPDVETLRALHSGTLDPAQVAIRNMHRPQRHDVVGSLRPMSHTAK